MSRLESLLVNARLFITFKAIVLCARDEHLYSLHVHFTLFLWKRFQRDFLAILITQFGCVLMCNNALLPFTKLMHNFSVRYPSVIQDEKNDR